MKNAGKTMFWIVGHPKIKNRAYVLAKNWELATVAAAAYWHVPWAKIAAECFKIDCHEAKRNVCGCCGQIFYGDGILCSKCNAKAESEAKNEKYASRDYWTRKNREWKERYGND